MPCNLWIKVRATRKGFVDIIRGSKSKPWRKKLWQPPCFPGLAQFFAFFVSFHKTIVSTHKTFDNKAPDQILLYFDHTLFRNEAANSGPSQATQPNCSGNVFVEKEINITHSVLEFCTGRFVTSAPWESTLQNNSESPEYNLSILIIGNYLSNRMLLSS